MYIYQGVELALTMTIITDLDTHNKVKNLIYKAMNIFNKVKRVLASVNLKGTYVMTINGKPYAGNNVTIVNDEVYIDDVKQDAIESKVINITINGNADNVSTVSGDIVIKGNAGNTVTSTSGDIEIYGDVEGSVNTISGDVEAKIISGSVSSISGNIKHGH